MNIILTDGTKHLASRKICTGSFVLPATTHVFSWKASDNFPSIAGVTLWKLDVLLHLHRCIDRELNKVAQPDFCFYSSHLLTEPSNFQFCQENLQPLPASDL
jgi:hypothetical protein